MLFLAEYGYFSYRISMEGGDNMIINHNISAVFATRVLSKTDREISKSIESFPPVCVSTRQEMMLQDWLFQKR
jgi:hypothetical protein